MNKVKTIQVLTKLASKLDESGKHNYANYVDEIILKIAEDLQPVGESYEKNGKFYQKFYNSQKGLVVKEVDKDGKIISTSPPTTTPTQPSTTQDDSWLSGFYDLVSALGGSKGDTQQKVETKMKEKEEEEK